MKVFDKEDLYDFFKYILPHCDEKAFLKIYYEWVDKYKIDYNETFLTSIKFKKIVEAFCYEFSIEEDELLGLKKTQRKDVAAAKKCLVHICSEVYKIPNSYLTDKMNYKCGSSITHHLDNFSIKKEYLDKYNNIINKIK